MKNYNKYTFGLGTVGRDMLYSMVASYLLFYLTDVINVDTNVLWWITGIMMAARVFDACNDPIMGVIVDNTKSKYGKFKPWILIGAVLASILTILLFTDFGLTGMGYVASFAVIYLAWGICFTMNDISYWSLLPALSQDQKEREEIGSVARICASIGMFLVVALIVPITEALGGMLGSLQKGWFALSIIIVVIMLVFQSITLLWCHENRDLNKEGDHTSLGELVKVIFGNDQLLVAAISMALFMIGYCTTTSFGLYYFKYVYGDEGMYTIFAVILGVSQIAALSIFPKLGKKYKRKDLFMFSTILVFLGYIIFFFAPTNTMLFIGIAGVLLFVGQAFIQVMMLMFLTDSVEYGEWKSGKRNDSVTLSLQPFINKMGGAIASGITGATVIISGMKVAETAADMTSEGLFILKFAMLLLPLIFIVISFIIYRSKYILDEELYAKIVGELNERKQSNA